MGDWAENKHPRAKGGEFGKGGAGGGSSGNKNTEGSPEQRAKEHGEFKKSIEKMAEGVKAGKSYSYGDVHTQLKQYLEGSSMPDKDKVAFYAKNISMGAKIKGPKTKETEAKLVKNYAASLTSEDITL